MRHGGQTLDRDLSMQGPAHTLLEGGPVHSELTAGKGFLFADFDEFILRGFEVPARLYEVKREH